MKFLHTGDLHIGRTLDMKSLTEDQGFILNQILEIVDERKPDFLIIAGDVYDRSIPREEAVRLYDEFITSLVIDRQVRVYAISGNHDSGGRLQGMNTLLKRAGYYVEGKLTAPPVKYTEVDEYGEVDIYMVPFKDTHTLKALFGITETSDTTEIYRLVIPAIEGGADRKIIIAHNYFSPGADSINTEISDSERRLNIGGEDIIDSQVLEGFSYAALGHLHKAQQVGCPHIRYAGSILKYSASEISHQKSITLVEMDEAGKAAIEKIPLVPLRDFRKLRGTLHEVSSIHFTEKKDDFFQIILTDETPVDNTYNQLSAIYPNLIGITLENIRSKEAFNPDMEAINRQDTFQLFSDFFETNSSRKMDQLETQFIAEVIREMEAELNDTN